MTVTARFYVERIERHAYNPSHATVHLQAAGRGEQNKAWSQATPSGTVTMQVNNPAAADWFAARLGQDLAVTFEALDEGRFVSPHSPNPVTEP